MNHIQNIVFEMTSFAVIGAMFIMLGICGIKGYFSVEAKCVGVLYISRRGPGYVGQYEYYIDDKRYIEYESQPIYSRPKEGRKCKVYVSKKDNKVIISQTHRREKISSIIFGMALIFIGILYTVLLTVV